MRDRTCPVGRAARGQPGFRNHVVTVDEVPALVAAFALTPLLFSADAPGKEILHPVAVVIFSGLISSTLLDTFLTPAMFWLFGRKPAEALMDDKDAEAL